MNDREWIDRYGPWGVVSGASAGIGRAFAVALAERGLNVALIGRSEAALGEAAAEVRELGRQALPVVADLGAADGRSAALSATASLDVGLLVASAGQRTIQRFIDNPLEDEMAMIDVNCRALAEMAHVFGRRLADRGRGGLVLLSSILAFQGAPNSANYAATKAFVQSLAEGLTPELRERGVDVLAVAPGPVAGGGAGTAGARANLRMGASTTPDVVAAEALKALGVRRIVRPGAATKVRTALLAPLPRAARVALMAKVMRRMTARMDARRRSEEA